MSVAIWVALFASGCGRIHFDLHGGSSCGQSSTDDLALYTFDADEGTSIIRDHVGSHDGTLIGQLAFIDGPGGCGRALSLPGDAARHARIPDDADWDLPVAAIELYLQIDSHQMQCILSRDAIGLSTSGHLTLCSDAAGRLGVRLQSSTGVQAHVCSDGPVPLATWLRVGINIGDPQLELWLDGVRQNGTGAFATLDPAAVCSNGTAAYGLDGNDNPWIVGGSGHATTDGTGEPVVLPFAGALDQLRISRSKRTFEASAL